MMNIVGLDTLRDIPGYTAIMRSVLKSLIQGLLEHLSEQTGEESVILTASLSDGTLCHLGSQAGKDFLEGRDEIKSQFLRHCLKKYHSYLDIPSEDQNSSTRRKDTYDESMRFSTASSSGHTPKENSSMETSQHRSVPQKRRKGKQHSNQDVSRTVQEGSRMTQSRSPNSYPDQNQSENEDSNFSKKMKTSHQPADTGDTDQSGNEIPGQVSNRSPSLKMETQTGSYDQNQNEETDAGTVKREPDESDATSSGMEMGQKNQMDDTETWSPSIEDLYGYNPALQGASNVSADLMQPYTEAAENWAKGDNCGLDSSQIDDANQELQDYENLAHDLDPQNIKKFPCEFCGKIFVRSGDKKRHMSVHTGERFPCFYCPKTFSQKYKRNVHAHHQCINRPEYTLPPRKK